ncbi:HECT domain-containing ubiquitin-protein ligase [Chloropicon primus]|uniref:HECT-type E3 ubiquitin transferase n=3 Tax=Chloropicon primus TaxID=1764295 RepID=A0A5B8MI87_9CHLO|nr:HECT domain-containing ubiquitin-protein ligase [Chloropicon primus]|eukprot:QDZ19375.1 HECT domain-containing ubiquitin-protein ligase [Chloropicon primus]
MRVKTRKNVKVPEAVREAIAAIADEGGKSDEGFLQALRAFEWSDQYQSRFDRGEFNHWLELFNLFDAWFEKHVKCHRFTLDWENEAHAPKEEFPVETCLEVLRVSRTILENCTSKHAYGSLDHLANLLAASQPEVVFASLSTLVTISRRSQFQSTARWHHGNTELYSRIFSLAQGWGGIEAYSSMYSCVTARGDPSDAASSSSGGGSRFELHFEFFRDEETKGKAKGHQVIQLKDTHQSLQHGSNLEVCEHLTKEYGVPLKLRFALLNRIRIVRSLKEPQSRVDAVRMRLSAFHILFQSSPDHEDLSLLLNEPDLVLDLLNILHNKEAGCGDLQNLAARALASMCCDRSRQSLFLRNLNSGKQKEKFVRFLKEVIEAANTGTQERKKLLESLLSLVSVLSVSNQGCAMLAQLGLVQILVDIIKAYTGPHLQIVSGAVRILEALVERDPSVMRTFREFQGLKAMIMRLQKELGLLENDSEMEDCKNGTEEQGASLGASKVLAKRFLVKSILRAAALTCYSDTEWSQSRLTFDGESSGLPQCLEAIFKQAKDLGSSVFSLASTVMADILHHDPTCFPIIEKHKLPKAFLETVQNGVLVTPDTVCCLPSTLVALCLNKKGLKAVQKSKVLDCLVSIFTSPQHCRALQGDTPSMLGNGLDELVRHVPEMKETCIDVMFTIVDKIMGIGEELKKEQQVSAIKNESGDDSRCDNSAGQASSSQPMDTDSTLDGSGRPSSSSQPSASDVYLDSMSEIVINVARLLEAMLSNPSVGKAFVQKGGIKFLLKLYTIPVKKQSPATTHQLFSTFRVLNPSHSKEVATSLIKELEALLSAWKGVESHDLMSMICSYMLEDHTVKKQPNGRSDDAKGKDQTLSFPGVKERPILGTLYALEGIFSLSGNLLRSSSLTLNGFSIDYSAKLLELLGSFQSSLIWCSCLFEEVKRYHDSKANDKSGSAPRESDGKGTSGKSVAEQSNSGAEPRGSSRQSDTTSTHKRYSKSEPFIDVVSRVLISVRQLFQALARNTQSDRGSSRSLHLRTSPRKQSYDSAAALARLCFDYFIFSEKQDDSSSLEKFVIDADKSLERECCQGMLRRAKLSFVSQSIEDISNLLADPRRKSCNFLLINAFIRGSVLQRTLKCLSSHVAMLCSSQSRDKEESKSLTKVITKILIFLGSVLNPSTLLVNTATSHLLLAKFPEGLVSEVFGDRSITEVDVPQDSNQLFMMVLHQVLEEATKAWKAGMRQRLPPQVISALLVIFHNAAREAKGTTPSSASVKEKAFEPSESIIEQILAMGFSRKQAETALNKVKSNNLEIAMEWLLNHPEEPEEEEEDDELARAMAMSLEPKDAQKKKGQKPSCGTQDVRQLHLPSVEDFLHVSFNCLGDGEEVVLTNSFALVEVLVRIVLDGEEKKEENTRNIVKLLMSKLSQSPDFHTFVALHILLLLSCKDEAVRNHALECGIIPRCVELLRTDSAKGKPQPRWMSPLLLELDCYLKLLSNPERVARKTSSGNAELKEAFEQLQDSEFQLEVGQRAHDALKSTAEGGVEQKKEYTVSLRKELCQACLQVIATVCRDHAIALKLYNMGMVDTILSIPSENQFPALEGLISTILRSIVEDEMTLQDAMELQICGVLKLHPKHRHLQKVELKTVSKSFLPFYSRDKKIFRLAVSSVCELQRENGMLYISLRRDALEDYSQKVQGKRGAELLRRSKSVQARMTALKRNLKASQVVFPSVVQDLLNKIISNASLLQEKTNQDDSACEDKDGEAKQTWLRNSVSTCLSILTDFCIHYSSCVHYILEVEADTNNVLSFIIDRLLHLQSQKKPSAALQIKERSSQPAVIAEKSSLFLVAVCSCSSLALPKILNHIVSRLMALPSYSSAGYTPVEVSKLRAYVEFVNSLLSNSNMFNGVKVAHLTDESWSKNVVQDMKKLKVVDGLVCAINNVDLHNPEASKVLNTILRPLNTILESLNTAAVAARVKANDGKKGSGAGGICPHTNASGLGSGRGFSSPNLDRHERNFRNVQYRSLGGYDPEEDAHMDDMENDSEDDNAMDSDSSLISDLVESEPSSELISESDGEGESLSRSTSSSSLSNISESDGGGERVNQPEGFQVVVSRVNDGADDHQGDDMNGHAHVSGDDDAGFHPHSRTLLRMSEVDIESPTSSGGSLGEHNDMLDNEDEYVFHERDDNSEEEWSDSPVIEVRVRSPFQMRFNNSGAISARESVGLQTGIPLLDNFFGALGVSDDGLYEPLAPRRLQSLARGSRNPTGLHPLFNPFYSPSNSRGSFGIQDYRNYRNYPSTSNSTSLFWESEFMQGSVNRMGVHQRLANLVDSFGSASPRSVWQVEAQNEGFNVFSSRETAAQGPNNSKNGRNALSGLSTTLSARATEQKIEELIERCVSMKKDVPPESAMDVTVKKEDVKPKLAGPSDAGTSSQEKSGQGEERGVPDSQSRERGSAGAEGTSTRTSEQNPSAEQPNQNPVQQAVASQGATNPSIDPAFLEALPENLREEVLSQGRARQTQRTSGVQELRTAQESAQDLDPEFLAALPLDIQNEVLAQQQSARNARAQQAATSGAEMDIASIIATFPPEIREEVLLTLDESIINSLPPDVLAEAQNARERVNSRSFQTYTFGQDSSYSAVTQRNGGPSRNSFPGRLILAQNLEGGQNNGPPRGKRGAHGNKLANRREILSHSQPPISKDGVASVVRLFRVASSLGKGLMQRVLMNICGHPESCRHLLACFSEILGHSMQKGKPGAEKAKGSDPSKSKRGDYWLYGCQGDAHFAQKSTYGVPTLILERIMSLLMYLIKHDAEISMMLLTHSYKRKRVSRDKKGKAARREDDSTTIVEQLFMLLSSEFENGSRSGMFDLVLQLLEGVLNNVTRWILKEREAAKKKEGDKKKEESKPKKSEPARLPEAQCQQAVQALSSTYLELLPALLAMVVERPPLDCVQKIMSYVCTILSVKHTKKMISALLAEGQSVISQCMSEVSQQISEKESSCLSIKSGFVLLKISSKIEQLKGQERKRHKDFELSQVDGFVGFKEQAQALWRLLEKQATTLEATLERIAPKEGAVPLAPQRILPYFPIMVCFAITSNMEEGSSGGKAANASDLTFLSFAEKHSLLVNSLIRHDPSCLEDNFQVLLKHPRLIEFENKCSYFRGRISKGDDHHHGSLRLNVRRDCVFEDSFHQLRHRTADEMQGRLNVQFQGEDGVDAGGLTREWYQVMSRAIFKEELALFTSGGNGVTFQPNPNSMIQNEGVDHLQYFKFVGRFVAKALVDGQILDAYFTRSLYKHLLGEPLSYEDIEAVDPDYFKNLKWMLENDIEGVLELTFTAEADYFDKKSVVELKPGGAKISVTNENKAEYVNLVAKHRMTNAIESQIKAFLEGFWELIGKDLLNIFTEKELELIISGTPDYDIGDLKQNTEYTGYFPSSKVVLWFWEILNELKREDMARLVQFVTGTSKVPLEGFKSLQGVSGPQKFQIHKAFVSTELLPTSHTCFNQLDIPEYETKEKLRERLLVAIREGAQGFGFV